MQLFKVLFVSIFIIGLFVAPVMAAESKTPTSMVTIGEGDDSIEPEDELKIGDVAPEFSLPNLSTDKMESLKDYLGKPIVLFFIQSACYSCLQEAKAMKDVKAKYGNKLNIIAVGVDLLGKPMLVSWAAHNKLNYPVLLDPIFSVPEKYGFSYTPSMVIIDKNGKVAFIHAGYREKDLVVIEEKVKELVGK